jgi:hypothetical protein
VGGLLYTPEGKVRLFNFEMDLLLIRLRFSIHVYVPRTLRVANSNLRSL